MYILNYGQLGYKRKKIMDKFKYYIENCVEEILERTIEASTNSQENKTEFQIGYTLAYNEVITFLLNQADIFQIKNDLSNKIQDAETPL